MITIKLTKEQFEELSGHDEGNLVINSYSGEFIIECVECGDRIIELEMEGDDD